MKNLACLATCLMLTFMANNASPTTYVDGECGNDSWTGTGWMCHAPSGPKRTIQAAIDAAVSGDLIVVYPAVYFENIKIAGKHLTITSKNPDDAAIVDSTVIDGGGADRVVTITQADTTILGLTIRNGNAKSSTPVGGGVLCNKSKATFVKSVIAGNHADGAGGGIFAWESILAMEHCTIMRNTVAASPFGSGGGLSGGAPGSSLVECTFEKNEIVMGDGGAISGFAGLIDKCRIVDNHITFEAVVGGGGLAACSGPILNSTISHNTVEFGHGGGMFNCSGPIVACTITDNIAFSGIGDVIPVVGGGLAQCTGPIINCIVSRNTAHNTDDARSESQGGGLANCTGLLINCTIADNIAVVNTFGSSGGGLWNCTGPISNCIIWDNAALNDAQLSASAIPTFGCIRDWPGGGTGNISTDPSFAVVGADYRLRAGSPCIDAGNNNAVPAPITTDLAGKPRFLDDPLTPDTGQGTPPVVDMGAYEFFAYCGDPEHPYPPMDFNQDCVVNVADLAMFAEHWLTCTKPECNL